jgi:predicted helicase
MDINEYIISIRKRYKGGISKEHSYRGDLEQLLRNLFPEYEITNEPANVTDCGNPDYVITKKQIPIGYIEAKDIGKDLNSKAYKEQFDRYRKALDKLIITDYLWFQFYLDGKLINQIRIGEILDGNLISKAENFNNFFDLLNDFFAKAAQTIKSHKKLAEMMAGKAKLLENTLEKALLVDLSNGTTTELSQHYNMFRNLLINDLTAKQFADIYAQTLAYGMFAARIHDSSLDTFSRNEAAELIPKSNPFLRKLFISIAGPDIDERIKTNVDNLIEVFRATDVKALMENMGPATQKKDPIIHFYETFLSLYNPKLRKSRGVWYTPEPVVKFIVRAIDKTLKKEFLLIDGLANISKTTILVDTDIPDKRTKTRYKQIEKSVHKVQILDPACGTGTFLAEVVKHIYKKFKGQEGIWSEYVSKHLIPRLNGFELLVAPYAMAHLKLDMLLSKTGYIPNNHQRLNVFLTNALQPHHADTGTLFESFLSNESSEANYIKRDSPVMVIMGNPPYSINSNNKGEWILNLITDYKKNLNERKINLDDDYIKFIRYGHHLVDKNGEGVFAIISNNSFLDGVTHRQMRKHLTETFNKIYIINLHGSTKKGEVAIDGGIDENVFDIMQGVSINIFIKSNKSTHNKYSKVFYCDIFGSRQVKYDMLENGSIDNLDWLRLPCKEPHYYFADIDQSGQDEYENGIYIPDLFSNYNSGIQTKCDEISIHFDEESLSNVISDFENNTIDELKNKYKKEDTSGWTYKKAQASIKSGNFTKQKISFRPFDERLTIYCSYSGGFIGRPREKTMRHLLNTDNLGILFPRQALTEKYGYFLTEKICDINYTGTAGQFGAGLIFPLYLYSETNKHGDIKKDRIPNLNMNIVGLISDNIGLEFTPEKKKQKNTFSPIDIVDYIYIILYSKKYRDKYKAFLMRDFPRVPFPKNADTFWKLVKLGGELRQVHLLKSIKVKQDVAVYPISGNSKVTRKIIKRDWELYDQKNGLGRIWINDLQYFDRIPVIAWETYIGGYQPAQKWLKDRYECGLEYEDIIHYKKIIAALSETCRITNKIDLYFK